MTGMLRVFVRRIPETECMRHPRRQTLSLGAVMLSPFAALRVNSAKHPRSLSLDGERKTQLQRSCARPKARRAQDDRRAQIRNSGLMP